MRRYLNLSSGGSGSPRNISLSVTTRPLSSLVLLSVISYLGREGEVGEGEEGRRGEGREKGEGREEEERRGDQRERSCVIGKQIHLHSCVHIDTIHNFILLPRESTVPM